VEADVIPAAGQAPAAPAVLEQGRYKVFEDPDGSWVLARAVGTCERCQDCGCGDQADPVHVPAMIIAMARAQAGNGGGGVAGLMSKLKAMRGGRGTGD